MLVDSMVVNILSADINIDIVIEKRMNALEISSSSSKALAILTSFELVPRKLECPCAVEGIMNVIAS